MTMRLVFELALIGVQPRGSRIYALVRWDAGEEEGQELEEARRSGD